INLSTLTLSGNLSVIAGGLVDFVGPGASTVSGTMNISTTAGGINDSGLGTLAVAGSSTLAATAANDIRLDNNNDFSTVTITSGNNVSLHDLNAINLGDLLVAGNLGVNAGGLVDFVGSGASGVGGSMGIITTAGGISQSGLGSLTVFGSSSLSA